MVDGTGKTTADEPVREIDPGGTRPVKPGKPTEAPAKPVRSGDQNQKPGEPDRF
jgi:hypothetical protein